MKQWNQMTPMYGSELILKKTFFELELILKKTLFELKNTLKDLNEDKIEEIELVKNLIKIIEWALSDEKTEL